MADNAEETHEDKPSGKSRRPIHYVMIALLLGGWLVYQISGRISALLLIWAVDVVVLIWETKRRIEDA